MNFEDLFEQSPESYLILLPNQAFTIIAANAAFLRVSMKERENILGRGVFEVFPDNPADPYADGVRSLHASLEIVINTRVANTMPVQKYDIKRPEREGGGFEERYWSAINTPVFNASGNLTCIIHRVSDVTEFVHLKQKENRQMINESLQARTEQMSADILTRVKEVKQAQEALRLSNRRYQTLTSMLPVGIFHTDCQGELEYVNPKWEEITGIKKSDVKENNWIELIHQDDRAKVLEMWQSKSLEPSSVECRFAQHGTVHWAIMQLVPELSDHDTTHVIGFVGSITDITVRKRYEEEQQHKAEATAALDRAKMAFFSNVTHEVRTPLTLILGPMEGHLGKNDPPMSGDDLNLMHRNTLRLYKLVNSLLEFSRLETATLQPKFEPVDLFSVTESVTSAFAIAIKQAGIQFVEDLHHISEPVYVDQEMWEKIAFNLISNAVKYTHEGRISVSLRQTDDGHAELSVSDTGIGIPEGELAKIFDRFYRVESARGRSYEGMGIGLSLCKELVKLHSGTITVTSEIDHGSTFVVKIPLGHEHIPNEYLVSYNSQQPGNDVPHSTQFVEEVLTWKSDSKSESNSTDQQPTQRGHILVVDDNADMRKYVKDSLSKCWRVTTASDGAEALQETRSKRFDLILTDIMMPMDGLTVIGELKRNEHTKNIPVIVLSAKAREDSVVEAFRLGADDYLVKPFSTNELVARVNTHLELKFLRENLEQQIEERTHELAMALKLVEEQQSKWSEEVEQHQLALQQFIDTLCHELRNPLNGILGGIEMLAKDVDFLESILKGRDGDDDETVCVMLARQREEIKAVQCCAKHQKVICDDVLNLSKLESGQTKLSITEFTLHQVQHSINKMLGIKIKENGLTFVEEYTNTDLAVMGDFNRLMEVLMNLISNSIKFTPQGGTITVRAKATPHTPTHTALEFVVSDTGIGIPIDEQKGLFQRFTQANRTNREYGGSGLGLCISKALIQLMGGAIYLTSTEGNGTTVTFTVVCETSGSTAKQENEPPNISNAKSVVHDSHRSHILIAEDNTINQRILQRVLESQGHTCKIANNGKEAVDISQMEHFDLILMDIEMPIMGGLEATQLIRQRELRCGIRSTPIIGLSGYTRDEHKQKGIAAGMNDYITKPYDKAILLERIKALTFEE